MKFSTTFTLAALMLMSSGTDARIGGNQRELHSHHHSHGHDHDHAKGKKCTLAANATSITVAPKQTTFATASYVSPYSPTVRHDDTCQVIRNCSTRWQEQAYMAMEIWNPSSFVPHGRYTRLKPSQWLDWISLCIKNVQDAPQKKLKTCIPGSNDLIPEKVATSCASNSVGVQADAEIVYSWIDRISAPGGSCGL